MEVIHVKEAVGMALCHDITKIIPNEFKGRAFKKGHIIRNEDISTLMDLGKDHVYVWNLKNGYVHEDDAALRIAKAISGGNISFTDPVEGKVELMASEDGLLKINTELLLELNMLDNISISSIHENQVVQVGKKLAGTRIIPLVIEESILVKLEELCSGNTPVIEIVPFKTWNTGLIVTGNEVFSGRIEDKFGPVILDKMSALKSEVIRKEYVPDSVETTSQVILDMIDEGAEMVILTGGMSVDPDDLTPSSIRAAGGRTIAYGAPVLPGAMFMLAYIGDVPVIGLPGCVMYHRASIFDLVVPRILAGESLTKRDLAKLSHGGFCLKCSECSFPDCSFGK